MTLYQKFNQVHYTPAHVLKENLLATSFPSELDEVIAWARLAERKDIVDVINAPEGQFSLSFIEEAKALQREIDERVQNFRTMLQVLRPPADMIDGTTNTHIFQVKTAGINTDRTETHNKYIGTDTKSRNLGTDPIEWDLDHQQLVPPLKEVSVTQSGEPTLAEQVDEFLQCLHDRGLALPFTAATNVATQDVKNPPASGTHDMSGIMASVMRACIEVMYEVLTSHVRTY